MEIFNGGPEDDERGVRVRTTTECVNTEGVSRGPKRARRGLGEVRSSGESGGTLSVQINRQGRGSRGFQVPCRNEGGGIT